MDFIFCAEKKEKRGEYIYNHKKQTKSRVWVQSAIARGSQRLRQGRGVGGGAQSPRFQELPPTPFPPCIYQAMFTGPPPAAFLGLWKHWVESTEKSHVSPLPPHTHTRIHTHAHTHAHTLFPIISIFHQCGPCITTDNPYGYITIEVHRLH